MGSCKRPLSRTRKKGNRGQHLRKANIPNNDVHNSSGDNSDNHVNSSNANMVSTPGSSDSSSNNLDLSAMTDKEASLMAFHEDNIPAASLTAKQCYIVDRNPFSAKNNNLETLKGRRIVDVAHFISEIKMIVVHSGDCKSQGAMMFQKEIRYGLVSKLLFKCDRCQEEKYVDTDPVPVKGNEPSVNKSAVWGFTSVGSGHAQLDEVFSIMGIPSITPKSFINIEEKVGEYWDCVFDDAIEAAGKEEYRLAVERGHVDPDGIPFITVTVDGGWCQRSYGHRFSAKSGNAVIIGQATGKILFLGVRNKYCSICVTGSRQEREIEHVCFRNWTDSSTGMESDIIVEGFCKSIVHHGLRYKRMIGDGDSSVLKNVIEKCSYGRDVKKVECANHAVRCYTKALYKLAKNAQHAKLLSKARIKRLTTAARGAIRFNGEERKSEAELKHDLMNGPKHVYGQHENCKAYFCNPFKDGIKTLNLFGTLPVILKSGIYGALESLARKADKMLENQTSNAAETYMNLVSKFIGHKQFFRSRRGSYNRRVKGAGLCQIYGSAWHQVSFKKAFAKSPSISLKRYTQRLSRKRELTRKRLSFANVKKHRRAVKAIQQSKVDIDYGPNAQQPDMEDERLEDMKQQFLLCLQKSEEEIRALEHRTKPQSECEEWITERRNRLTASNFGTVAKMKETTSCVRMVKAIVYPRPLATEAIQYGKDNEVNAIKKYEEVKNVSVEKSGLFVSIQTGYLAASPDGLLPDGGLLEVKCPKTAENTTLEMLAKSSSFCSKQQKDGSLSLKRTHNYFFQVQGQLYVTGRKHCDFVIWSPTECSIERIMYDETFCERMLVKLKRFYLQAVLPELVDPRSSRSMDIREAPYVLAAKANAPKQVADDDQMDTQ